MRGALTALAVVLVAALLTGMGDFGGTPQGTIPKPKENVKVFIVDRLGVSTDLSRFSMQGKVSLEGRRGSGDMSILFRDIQEINFGTTSGDVTPADLLLRTGMRVQLTVPRSAVFYGDTGYGAFWISAQELRRVVFTRPD